MRSSLLAVLLLVLPGLARADAIDPFPGECPPGLRRGISDHSEVCIPTACEAGAACPSGSECRPVSECWAPRPYRGSGREPVEDPPPMVDQVIGLCAGGTCTEGRCATRRQCEPTAATPAWDPSARRWTERPHVASSPGCSLGGRASCAPLPLLAVALLVVLRADRRSRASQAR